MSARFLFAATQLGAERALKNELAREHPTLRFAFSRPGFVTFRLPDELNEHELALHSVFARTWGHSLGKVGGADDGELARDAWQLVSGQARGSTFRHLHVWSRERLLPGDEGFDGAADERAVALGS